MLKQLKHNIYYLSNLVLFVVLAIILLILPFFLYKIGVLIDIFPSIEIILIYYFFNKNEKFKTWILMGLTVFLDQINNISLGTSIISIMLANFVLDNFQNWLNKKDNNHADYILFSCYVFLVFVFKYILMKYQGRFVANVEFSFQYLTTLFTYPFLKFILDKLPDFLSYNAKADSN